jgi:hypothetical protein
LPPAAKLQRFEQLHAVLAATSPDGAEALSEQRPQPGEDRVREAGPRSFPFGTSHLIARNLHCHILPETR